MSWLRMSRVARVWTTGAIASMVLFVGGGCKRSSATGSEIGNQRLHDHIVENHRPVFVDHLGADTLWSDSAIFERAAEFPKPIRELVASGTERGSADAAIRPKALVNFLEDVDRRKGEWRAGETRRKGTGDYDCEVYDASATAVVNCVYVNYLVGRYPSAKFRVKAQYEPVLLLDGDVVRAALMPMKF
jgi:hypothetical protein